MKNNIKVIGIVVSVGLYITLLFYDYKLLIWLFLFEWGHNLRMHTVDSEK